MRKFNNEVNEWDYNDWPDWEDREAAIAMICPECGVALSANGECPKCAGAGLDISEDDFFNAFTDKIEECNAAANKDALAEEKDEDDEEAEDGTDGSAENVEEVDLQSQVKDALDSFIPEDDEDFDIHTLIDAVLAYFDDDSLEYIRSVVCPDTPIDESLKDGHADTHEEKIIDGLISELFDKCAYSKPQLIKACRDAGMTDEEINAFVITLDESINESGLAQKIGKFFWDPETEAEKQLGNELKAATLQKKVNQQNAKATQANVKNATANTKIAKQDTAQAKETTKQEVQKTKQGAQQMKQAQQQIITAKAINKLNKIKSKSKYKTVDEVIAAYEQDSGKKVASEQDVDVALDWAEKEAASPIAQQSAEQVANNAANTAEAEDVDTNKQ